MEEEKFNFMHRTPAEMPDTMKLKEPVDDRHDRLRRKSQPNAQFLPTPRSVLVVCRDVGCGTAELIGLFIRYLLSRAPTKARQLGKLLK